MISSPFRAKQIEHLLYLLFALAGGGLLLWLLLDYLALIEFIVENGPW